MTDAANTLLHQVMSLCPEDRAELAGEILDSLGDDLLPDDPEFHAMIARRLEEADEHPERLLDAKQAIAEMRAELASRRSSRRESGA